MRQISSKYTSVNLKLRNAYNSYKTGCEGNNYENKKCEGHWLSITFMGDQSEIFCKRLRDIDEQTMI